MARVTQQGRVRRGTPEMFREEVESSYQIYKHTYEPGDIFQLVFLKAALADEGIPISGVIPSWEFFFRLTGEMPDIKEYNIIGEFEYKEKLPVEENIKNYFIDMVKKQKPLPTTSLFSKSGFTFEEILAWAGIPLTVSTKFANQPMDTLQPTIDILKTNFNTKYQAIKSEFIQKNTKIIIDYSTIAGAVQTVNLQEPSVPFGQQMNQIRITGSVEVGEEEADVDASEEEKLRVEERNKEKNKVVKMLEDLSRFQRDVVENYFKMKNPTIDISVDPGKKIFYEFLSGHTIIDPPHLEGVTYACEIKVLINGDKAPNAKTVLKFHDLRRLKDAYNKLQTAINASKAMSSDMDYIVCKLTYPEVTGTTNKFMAKGESSKAKTYSALEVGEVCHIDRTDVLNKFRRIVFQNCFKATTKWSDFNSVQAIRLFVDWLNENLENIQEIINAGYLSLESIDKYRDLLTEIAPETVQVIFGNKMALNPQSQPVQQPAPQPVQQPVQQTQPVQQPVSQATQPTQQPVPQPAQPFSQAAPQATFTVPHGQPQMQPQPMQPQMQQQPQTVQPQIQQQQMQPGFAVPQGQPIQNQQMQQTPPQMQMNIGIPRG